MQFLDRIQALNFYHRLTQSHSLEFAKKESLDLIHWIILSDHCSIHLRPWNHNQLTRFSSQDSSGITTLWACVYRLCVFLWVCTPWTCVSSFALYSWLLMASSTPYPDRYTFFPLDFCRRRRKKRKDGLITYLKLCHTQKTLNCKLIAFANRLKDTVMLSWWQNNIYIFFM